jgi:uncharacterized SAM-binding protein YcdF (DUF218 family)
MKKLKTAVKILLGLAGLLLLLGLAALLFPRQILTVDSGPVKADALVVLGGGMAERPERAAELFKQGDAPKILVSGFGDCGWNQRQLEKLGVPGTAIILEPNSRSTRENAEFSIRLLQQMGAQRVIIVTSWYHSRRALECFEHYAPDIHFYSRPSYFGYAPKGWKYNGIGHYVKNEYAKLLGYWVCYGVCPI